MEKRMNRTWLLLFAAVLIIAAIGIWLWVGRSTGNYSGGLLIQLPEEVYQVADMGEYR